MFWVFLLGTTVLPILCLSGMSLRISEFCDYSSVFYPMAFVCLIMLALTSASCVRHLPGHARVGMFTVGLMLLILFVWFLVNASALIVGTPA
jgi:hypothetical protein